MSSQREASDTIEDEYWEILRKRGIDENLWCNRMIDSRTREARFRTNHKDLLALISQHSKERAIEELTRVMTVAPGREDEYIRVRLKGLELERSSDD